MKTYWLIRPRGFQNEYTVGVATSVESAEQYRDEGYDRIDRDHALRLMSRRTQSYEQLYAGVTIDGDDVGMEYYGPQAVARAIRTGAL